MGNIIKSFSVDTEILDILKSEDVGERGQSEFFRKMIKKGYASSKIPEKPEPVKPVEVELIG